MFSIEQWSQLLEAAQLEETIFLRNLFDPDFFHKKRIPNYNSLKFAGNIEDFFGPGFMYGPLSDQMAFVDMRIGRRKLFRGTLHAFLGKETFFPLINSRSEKIKIEAGPQQILLYCMEETTGLVMNGHLKSSLFSADHFHILLKEIEIGNYTKTLLTGFEIEGAVFKNGKMDAVVLSRSAFTYKR